MLDHVQLHTVQLPHFFYHQLLQSEHCMHGLSQPINVYFQRRQVILRKPYNVNQVLVTRYIPNNSEATNQHTDACILDLAQWLQHLSNKPPINQIVEIFLCFV